MCRSPRADIIAEKGVLLTIAGELDTMLGLHAPVGQDVAQLGTVLEDLSDEEAAVAVDRLAATAHQRETVVVSAVENSG